jgi:hypothetical protein
VTNRMMVAPWRDCESVGWFQLGSVDRSKELFVTVMSPLWVQNVQFLNDWRPRQTSSMSGSSTGTLVQKRRRAGRGGISIDDGVTGDVYEY